jgi:long-subunit fatty acid transport protein
MRVSRVSVVLFLAICVIVHLGLSRPRVLGQERIEIPSSFNPVGSGARALGMGGAFIAVADDATAASWNPGGLIQLERPEISVVGDYLHRIEDNTFETNPEASGDQSVDDLNLNYLSAAYPFTLFDQNMIVSLNYQNLYDFTRRWDFPLVQDFNGLSVDQIISHKQDGDLYALGIAYCIQIIPQLSFGFTLNIWDDFIYENEWKTKTRQVGSGNARGNRFNFETETSERFSFNGFNANVGALWHVTDKLTLGAVFKTPFTADLDKKSEFRSSITFPDFPAADSSSRVALDEDEDLDMPMSYGIGLAYRFSDALTVSMDIYRTEWQDFELKDEEGNKSSPISGLPIDESDVDATHQVRIGAEYLFITEKFIIPARAGFFYDPAPAEGSPDDFFGFALGSGVAYDRFVFDVAYQYRFGRDVGESILQNFGFSQDVDEHRVYTSVIIHF